MRASASTGRPPLRLTGMPEAECLFDVAVGRVCVVARPHNERLARNARHARRAFRVRVRLGAACGTRLR